MGRRRRLPSDTVHPAWALPALSIQMNWDGKPPFIPSNIQATALGTASATRLGAGREHGACVCQGRSMCPSLSSLSHKGCFYTTKIKRSISPEWSLLQNKESGAIFFKWYYRHGCFVKPIKNLSSLCGSKVDFFPCINPNVVIFYVCSTPWLALVYFMPVT